MTIFGLFPDTIKALSFFVTFEIWGIFIVRCRHLFALFFFSVYMSLILLKYCFIDQSRKEIHQCTEQSNFIETDAYNVAKEKLRTNGHLVITGKPGAGKSRLTFQLLNDISKSTDEDAPSSAKDPVLLESPKDVLRSMKQHGNLAIAVEDAFGKDNVSYHVARTWSENAQLITLKCTPISKGRGNCLIINMRKDTFDKKEAIVKGKLLFSPKNVVDLDKFTMSDKDKTAILREYIPNINNYTVRSILMAKARVIGFPQCCYILSETLKEEKHAQNTVVDMFENPVLPLKEELFRLQTAAPLQYIILALVLLEEGCHNQLLTIDNLRCKRLLQIYLSEDTRISNEKLADAARACCPFY